MAIEVNADKEDEEVLDCKVIGLCSMAEDGADKDPSRTMHLAGKMGGIPLMVLIDSGASHDFISPDVVSGLGLNGGATQRWPSNQNSGEVFQSACSIRRPGHCGRGKYYGVRRSGFNIGN